MSYENGSQIQFLEMWKIVKINFLFKKFCEEVHIVLELSVYKIDIIVYLAQLDPIFALTVNKKPTVML